MFFKDDNPIVQAMERQTQGKTLPLHVYAALTAAEDPVPVFKGLQKYLNSTVSRQDLESEIVWNNGFSQLKYYAPECEIKTSLFLVPSVINGPEIFDIHPEHSFIRFLRARGVGVYLLNWGDLNIVPGDKTLSYLLDHVLADAFKASCAHAGSKIHILGYCLGGSFAATALIRENITPKSLTLLATPLDFQSDHLLWGELSPIRRFAQQRRRITRQMLSGFFSQLNPEFAYIKYANFALRNRTELEDKVFICVEDWLNDGNDLPATLAVNILDNFFDQNILKDFHISHPLCIVASPKDRLVPLNSTQPFQNLQAHVIQPDCGHIGMMAGSNAQKEFWQPYLKWLSTNKVFAAQ